MLKCAICENDSRFEPVLSKGAEAGFTCHLKKCPRCEFIFMDPQPDVDLQKNLINTSTVYDSKLPDEQETQNRQIILDYIERFAKPPGRLLELGCARGYLLAAARGSGWQTVGVEFSSKWAEYARSRLKLDIIETWLDGDSFDLKLTGKFDVIVMWHMLEHINNPKRFLERVGPYLKNSGILIVQVPDFAKLGETIVGCHHLNYFTRDTLRRLMEHDYYVIDVTYDYVNKFVSMAMCKTFSVLFVWRLMEFPRIVTASLHTITAQGFTEFLRQAREKIRHREFRIKSR